MSIGVTLKRFRSRTQYSQQDIVDMLEVDRLTYVNWENETTEVKSRYIPKLANIFGVKIESLFEPPSTSVIQVGGQIIIKVSDQETAEKLGKQIQELIKTLLK